jgi:PAS domain S-box-containing protein
MCWALEQVGLKCLVCTPTDFQAQLTSGAGTLLLTEEALTPTTIATIKETIEAQPGWSDLPLVLLVNESWQALKTLSFAGAATVLERPTRIPTLITVVRAALTARRRQYQLRDLLRQQENVNEQLETRVKEHTSELREANTQLKGEIAEHKKAKQDLLESEGRFEKAFRVGPVAASITTLDVGRFVDVNKSFEKLTGYTCEEVVGQTDQALAMWASADDQAKMTEALRGSGSYHDLELHVRIKEGDTRAILASAEVIEVDSAPCLLHMFYDITERKQNEEEMLQAVNEVMQDAAWFSRSLVEKLAQVRAKRAGNHLDTKEVAELTKREKQVLEQMARGRSNAAIAANLGLAEQTVRNYITNLYEKLGVHSRAQAVVWARERGLANS